MQFFTDGMQWIQTSGKEEGCSSQSVFGSLIFILDHMCMVTPKWGVTRMSKPCHGYHPNVPPMSPICLSGRWLVSKWLVWTFSTVCCKQTSNSDTFSSKKETRNTVVIISRISESEGFDIFSEQLLLVLAVSTKEPNNLLFSVCCVTYYYAPAILHCY